MFYSQLRTDCHKADHFNAINNSLHKKTLNKFLLGNHQLLTETGRHTIPKTPEYLRICPFCQLNEAAHEFHFIFSYHLYNNLLSKFLADINKRYPHFSDLDKNLKIVFLFNNVDSFICRLTAAYVYLCMELRQSLVIWCNIWIYYIHFWNHWLSLQSDWLSGVRFIPKSHYFLL